MITVRQKQIVEYLKAKQHARVDEIAAQLFISPATVRRELTTMERLGLVHRDHGGASIAENADDISIMIRRVQRVDSKMAVARIAERALPDFATAFIDNSSTALVLAQRLSFRHKTVVTNGITVAMHLAKDPDTRVHLLGGTLDHSQGSMTGSGTVKAIEEMQFHLFLGSCTSISERGAFESTVEQRDIKRAALLNSRCRVLLADASKFSRQAMYRTATLTDYDLICTDADSALIAPLRAMEGVRIINSEEDPI